MENDLSDALAILKEANGMSITLFSEDGNLRMRVPEDRPADERFLARIRELKNDILLLLGPGPGGSIDWASIYRQRQSMLRPPLSFNQESLWLIDRREGSLPYHISVVFRVEGDLNRVALDLAFRRLVARHEILRTRILHEDGIPWQQIDRVDSRTVFTCHPPIGHDEAEIIRPELNRLAGIPFCLDTDAVLRAHLLPGGGDEAWLLINIHHIAADGLSMGLLLRELRLLYNGFERGEEPCLSPLPLQYADYALWQRRQWETPRMTRMLNYWQNKLSGATHLQLPFKNEKLLTRVPSAGSEQITLDYASDAALTEATHCWKVTLFMTLLSGFYALLYRYTGVDDICIGTPLAGRPAAELGSLIGYFVNPVALRCRVTGEMSFRQLLEEVRKAVIEAQENQEAPFARVVEAVLKTRVAGKHPFFNTLFSLEYEQAGGEDWGRARVRPAGAEFGQTPFDMILTARKSPDAVRLGLVFDTGHFRRNDMQRLLTHLETLLKAAVASPDEPIGRLPLISPAEQGWLEKNTGGGSTTNADGTVPRLFRDQVEQTPEAIAIEGPGGRLTYARLGLLSNRLANYLRRSGIGKEDRVAICMERSADLLVGILAIGKAGGAYVPVDPAYPPSRIAAMLEDSEARMILCSKACEKALPVACSLPVIVTEIHEEAIASESPVAPSPGPQSSDLAYIMYTSGSTGKPKGVMITHSNIASLIGGAFLALKPEDSVLATGSPSFDAATFEYWCTLCSGARLVLYPQRSLMDAATLSLVIKKERITTVWLTAGWFHQLIDNSPDVFESLRTVIAGGDRLSPAHVSILRRKYPLLRLINGYGPTENTTFSLTYPVPPDYTGGDLPIGRPLAGRRVFILDTFFQPVPEGIPGEIFVGGEGLSRGYWRQPQRTAEKFIRLPLPGVGENPVYRTGDLGKWLSDGNVAYLGRLDRQVKINGFRVEPAETETMIIESGLVKQVAVEPRSINGSQILAAYMVPAAAPDTGSLVAFLRERLPAYLLPSAWIWLDVLPLTPNGKLDREALPPPATAGSATAASSRPLTATERELAVIWADLLVREQVGAQDNFFELGGHSLLAIRLSELLRKRGYQVEYNDIFTHQTVEQLAAVLIADKSAGNKPVRPLDGRSSRNREDVTDLLLVPGSPGFCAPYEELATALGDRYRVHGLELAALKATPGRDPVSMERLAHWAETSFREVQPNGPYRLLGHSFGAYLMYELASRWQAKGEKIAALVLLDVPHEKPGLLRVSPEQRPEAILRLANRILQRCESAVAALSLLPRQWRELPLGEQTDVLISTLTGALPDDEANRTLIASLEAALIQSSIDWHPHAHLDAETLLVCAEEGSGTAVIARGWAPYLRWLQVESTPGDHESMVRGDNAGHLARRIDSFLAGRQTI